MNAWQEAVNGAALDHRCPTCKAEPDLPCRDLRDPARPCAHPHLARQQAVRPDELAAYGVGPHGERL